MTDPWKKFLQEELNKEADKIEAEVMKDDSLKDVKTTPEMYEALMEKIRDADAEKGVNTEADRYSALTEEEREFLRIGREIKKQGAKIVYKRKKKRMAFLFVAVMVIMVAGMGVTSVGGPQYVLELLTQKMDDTEMIRVDSDSAQNSEENIEVEVYDKAKKDLGIELVRLDYLPNDTIFKDGIVDKTIQKVDMYYQMGDSVLKYQAKTAYSTSSFALFYEDEKKEEYSIEHSGVEILVKKYVILDTGEIFMTGQFKYNNTLYFISGRLEQDEFEKILNNLHF